MSHPFHITNEIGQLQSVIIKKPGKEIENLTPDTMKRLLFDDIPYLNGIQKEHDAFAKVLQENGAEVYYLEKLAAEAIDAGDVREQFVDRILFESYIEKEADEKEVKNYLLEMETQELVDATMAGIRKDQVLDQTFSSFQQDDSHSLFLMEPMPNLYYTRDPAVVLDRGISLNKLTYTARKRESLYMETIVEHHPLFNNKEIIRWRERDSKTSIEGGDILVLGQNTLAVGISERTSYEGMEELARLLFEQNSEFTRMVAIRIPHVRAMMHLDTVFTMVDKDAFTVHPGILKPNGEMPIFLLEKSSRTGEINTCRRSNLKQTLEEVLHSPIRLIPCGGGDPVAAPREQWNDGSNTLAVSPGVVITYDRNHVTNELLRKEGIKVIEIPSGELSRGRGGPRCMSMPLKRETAF